MTKDDIKKNELSISQQQAIHLLLTGLNDKQVAAELGVARQTVTNWRNHDSIFMAGLNSERKAVWQANQERMRSLMARSVDVLTDCLESENERLRQSTAVQILKICDKRNLAPSGWTQPELIEDDWARNADVLKVMSKLSPNL